MSFKDSLSNLLKFEIDNVNKHLPKQRISLKLALSGLNHYTSKDGQKLYINKKELELLENLCPQEKIADIRLPIILVRRRDLGAGTYIVGGELIEEFLIFKTLEKYEEEWDTFLEYRKSKKHLFLYKPDLLVLRKKLPTATAIGFT